MSRTGGYRTQSDRAGRFNERGAWTSTTGPCSCNAALAGLGSFFARDGAGEPIPRIRTATDPAGELIGFLIPQRVSDLLEIDLLGVTLEKRRCGAGAALLEELIASERTAGAREVRLELRASDTSAQALYAGLDFVVVGRRARYYPDGEDALGLTRVLSYR